MNLNITDIGSRKSAPHKQQKKSFKFFISTSTHEKTKVDNFQTNNNKFLPNQWSWRWHVISHNLAMTEQTSTYSSQLVDPDVDTSKVESHKWVKNHQQIPLNLLILTLTPWNYEVINEWTKINIFLPTCKPWHCNVKSRKLEIVRKSLKKSSWLTHPSFDTIKFKSNNLHTKTLTFDLLIASSKVIHRDIGTKFKATNSPIQS